VLRRRAAPAACAHALLDVAPAPAAPPATPTRAQALAGALKVSMKKTYKTTVPGLVFGRVTCTLAKDLKSGRCQARFTYEARRLRGVYQVAASIDRASGGVRWRATSVACTHLTSGAKIAC
jgi:hypothetical protein